MNLAGDMRRGELVFGLRQLQRFVELGACCRPPNLSAPAHGMARLRPSMLVYRALGFALRPLRQRLWERLADRASVVDSRVAYERKEAASRALESELPGHITISKMSSEGILEAG